MRGCGLEWTLLRPRAFMSNSLSWAASVRRERTVRALYGSAPNACVDPRDIAEAAARALTEEGHAGRAYTLTGPQALTAVEQTRRLGRLLGIPLRFEELTLAQARTALAGRFPPPLVEALLASAERQRAGAKAHVDNTVPDPDRPPGPHLPRLGPRPHRSLHPALGPGSDPDPGSGSGPAPGPGSGPDLGPGRDRHPPSHALTLAPRSTAFPARRHRPGGPTPCPRAVWHGEAQLAPPSGRAGAGERCRPGVSAARAWPR